jgi:hypothetical protein
MTTVVLGNRHAVQGKLGADGETEREVLPRGKRATIVDLPDEWSLGQCFTNITDPRGVWAAHVEVKEGKVPAPAWVASDNNLLAQLIAEHFGCERRELESSGGTLGAAKALPVLWLTLAFLLWHLTIALKTNAGNDFQAKQMAGSASATAVAKWVAITANTTAPAVGDTTLTGEITTAGGGLVRAVGAYAHTTSAASYTITTTFTANGSDSLPVTIGKRAHFDAASTGNMVFETLVSPTATLSASGDSLTLTDTVSL